MSPHDALLEELGLAPLWVRRHRDGAAVPVDASEEATGHAPLTVLGQVPAQALRDASADVRGSDAANPPTDAPAMAVDEVVAEDRGVVVPTEALVREAVEAPIRPAIPSDIASLDFAGLRARVAECTACGLCEKRTQTVFGVGDEGADWMIVGEAPGENEDRIGEPFVGQAGKLLDNMLHALGLNRTRQVYIANVIKCRPPGNRDPHPDEVARCEPFLKQQVALIRPKVIVALGRFAAQTLLKSDATISSLRGHVHEYEGVPVIVTYHPAYLLRTLSDKSKAWTDLCLAQATYRKVSA